MGFMDLFTRQKSKTLWESFVDWNNGNGWSRTKTVFDGKKTVKNITIWGVIFGGVTKAGEAISRAAAKGVSGHGTKKDQ
jgi:hypothetical protein